MRRTRPARLVAVLALLGLTACGGSSGPVTPGPRSSAPVVVDRGAPSTAHLLERRRAAGIADCPVSDPAVPARPDGLPDITLDCLGADSRVRLAGLRGKPIVANVWAQWCGPCRHEAPMLKEVQDRLGDRVLVLGVDHADPRPDLAIEFAEAAGWRYPQVVDAGKALAGPLRIVGPPMTVLVDADGRIVHRHVGPFTSTEQALGLIADHLGVRP
ncbi:TlpA family protein disulfide reductase [Mariniluteicoccus flavus]